MRVRAGAVGKASREVAVAAIDMSNHSGETNRDSFQQASARSLRRDTAGARARGGLGAGSDPRRPAEAGRGRAQQPRSEEHTSELQSLMRISYAVFCLKKKKKHKNKVTD